MGLNSVIESAVEAAFSAASDLVGNGVLIRTSTGAYDPILDQVTGGTNELSGIRMLRTSAEQKDMEASPAVMADYKILIPKKDLKGVRPTTSDIIRLDGFTYNILKAKEIPGKSLWSILCLLR